MTLVLPISSYTPALPSTPLGEETSSFTSWDHNIIDNKGTTQTLGESYYIYLNLVYFLDGIDLNFAGANCILGFVIINRGWNLRCIDTIVLLI